VPAATSAQVRGSRAALQLAESLGGAEQALHARGALGAALAFGDSADEGIAELRRGLDDVRSSQDVAQLDWFTAVLANAIGMRGTFDEADALIAAYHAAGHPAVDLLPSRSAVIDWWRGRWASALANCRASQALAPGAAPIHSAWAQSLAGLVEAAMGNRSAALPHLAQGECVYGRRRLFWFSARHDWAFGLAQWFMGDAEVAVDHLRRAADETKSMGAIAVEAQTLPDVIEVLVHEGEVDEAAMYYERLREFTVRRDTVHLTGQRSYAQGVLLTARGDRGRAAAAFTAAAATAGAVGTPFIRARSLEHLAACLPEPDAITPLSEAARLYAALPAPGHESHVLARLRALGPAGRRQARSLGELTAREQEVLALARRGLTARDIAGRLTVSERTVETHLAHIYQKLGVTGRRELLGERRVD
jgi:DNA-binding CsgD family transcriptional regulator